jgi:low temperature requirement protein LtrA
MLRSRDGDQRVTNIELFFDLVYVFAVTQLSHGLLNHLTVEGALQTALLLGMVWLVWAYTTWVTNWLDPDRTPTRLMLIALMLAGLVMSTGLPEAFGDRDLAVGGAYAAMQVGRSAYTVIALRGNGFSATSSESSRGAWSAARSQSPAGSPTSGGARCYG